MAYTPPLGSSVGLGLPANHIPTLGGDVNLEFDPATTFTIRTVGGIGSPTSQTGFKVNNQRANLYLAGIPPPSFLSASTIEKASIKVYPSGIASPTQPSQSLVYRQVINSLGIASPESRLPVSRIRLAGGYNSPPGSSVILDLRPEAYYPPPASSVILEFGALGYTTILGAGIGDSSAFGNNQLTKQFGVSGISVGDSSAFGTLLITTGKIVQQTSGIAAPSFTNVNSIGFPQTGAISMNFMMMLF